MNRAQGRYCTFTSGSFFAVQDGTRNGIGMTSHLRERGIRVKSSWWPAEDWPRALRGAKGERRPRLLAARPIGASGRRIGCAHHLLQLKLSFDQATLNAEVTTNALTPRGDTAKFQ